MSLLDLRIETQKKIIEKYESLIRGLTDVVFHYTHEVSLVPFSKLYAEAGEGGTPSTSHSDFYSGGAIPFIKIDDMVSKYLVAHKDHITEQGMNNSSAWMIPSGSVIYSNGATIGAISINKYPVCTKQGILGIVPNKNVHVEYLYYLMTSQYFRKEITKIITEGTIKTAYLKDINKIKCPLPDYYHQVQIAGHLSSITKKIELEQQTLSVLQSQKQYMLWQLFI
jgi:type I restriction enzyme S subunit